MRGFMLGVQSADGAAGHPGPHAWACASSHRQRHSASPQLTPHPSITRRALVQQLDIQTQMAAHAHLKAAEAEDKLHASELARASETRYMQRVAAAEAAIAPPKYFGRKKVDWFS